VHDISESLCLATEIVTKEGFSLRRFRSNCNEADVRALCIISYCICIRTLSSRNRITTQQTKNVLQRFVCPVHKFVHKFFLWVTACAVALLLTPEEAVSV